MSAPVDPLTADEWADLDAALVSTRQHCLLGKLYGALATKPAETPAQREAEHAAWWEAGYAARVKESGHPTESAGMSPIAVPSSGHPAQAVASAVQRPADRGQTAPPWLALTPAEDNVWNHGYACGFTDSHEPLHDREFYVNDFGIKVRAYETARGGVYHSEKIALEVSDGDGPVHALVRFLDVAIDVQKGRDLADTQRSSPTAGSDEQTSAPTVEHRKGCALLQWHRIGPCDCGAKDRGAPLGSEPDRNMEGAREFINAILMGGPIWPNPWGQDVAAAAYFIHRQRTDASPPAGEKE